MFGTIMDCDEGISKLDGVAPLITHPPWIHYASKLEVIPIEQVA